MANQLTAYVLLKVHEMCESLRSTWANWARFAPIEHTDIHCVYVRGACGGEKSCREKKIEGWREIHLISYSPTQKP